MNSRINLKNVNSYKTGEIYFLLYFFFFIFIGCNKKKTDQKIEDFYKGSINVKSDFVMVNANAEILNDSFLVFCSQNLKLLQYHNIFDSSIHYVCTIPKTSAHFGNMFFDADTLCLLSYNQEIYKFLDNVYMNKTPLQIEFEDEKDLEWGMFNTVISPIADKNKYYAYTFSSGRGKVLAQKVQMKIKEGPFFCLDGKSGKILFRMGGRREAKDNIYYHFSNQAHFVQSDTNLGVVLHKLDNFATVWNRYNGQFIRRVSLPFLNNYTQKDAYDTASISGDYERLFDLTHPGVKLFYYDKHQKLYYILQRPKIPLNIANKEVSDPYLSFKYPNKLFVLNQEFKLKYIFNLDPSIYVLNHFLCTAKGLMIGKLRDKNDLSPFQKQLDYDIFKF